MAGFNKLFVLSIALYGVICIGLFYVFIKTPNLSSTATNLFVHEYKKASPRINQTALDEDRLYDEKMLTAKNEKLNTRYNELVAKYDLLKDDTASLKSQLKKKKHTPVNINRDKNPFALLGAYPDPKPFIWHPSYHVPHLGLINDDNYCEIVDLYNLRHPENIFETQTFFTDFFNTSMVKYRVMPKLGNISMPQISTKMDQRIKSVRRYILDYRINTFYIGSDAFYAYHEIGKNFLCATQSFNHIPGHRVLIRKDEVLVKIADYAKTYKDRPQCFKSDMAFLESYRLFDKEECVEFFKLIHSKEYKSKLAKDPIQYLIKVGHGAHKSQGVFLLDETETVTMNNQYDMGKKCGSIEEKLIAQKYITNPLLLDMDNKFDLRVYMLIISTNPLIVYAHDGYLRVSINSFDKFSKDRATHLTNTYVAEKKFAEAKRENKTINGMNAQELKEYHLWDFARLEKYLIESKKVNDTNWLNNYLRPALDKAFIHIVRMTKNAFWNQSNVYELHGLDFMLDEDMKLSFIECNPSPLLDGVKPKLINQMLHSLFEVQLAYYRSRMSRVFEVVKKMQEEMKTDELVNIEEWKGIYQEASKNRLEAEYSIPASNSFRLIMDESRPGVEAYFGHVPNECLDN